MELPINEGGRHLLLGTPTNVSFLDIKTGEIMQTLTIESEIASISPYTNRNSFLLTLLNGRTYIATDEYNQLLDVSYQFECTSTLNDHIIYTNWGYVVLEQNDNKITVYTTYRNESIIPTDQEISLPDNPNTLSSVELESYAQEYHLENPDLISEIYFSPDNKYCMITYWNNTLAIYDTDANKVLNTIENAHSTDWYLGTDKEGYTYLSGFNGCYILNKNMQPIAWIPNGADVDLDNQKIFIRTNSTNYEAPIYSLEELLEMGRKYKEE